MSWRYNLRSGPSFPHRDNDFGLDIDTGLDNLNQGSELSSTVRSPSVPSYSESLHESEHSELTASRTVFTSYLPTGTSAPVELFDIAEFDTMSLLSVHHSTGLFTGLPDGPSILHLRQNYATLKTELKLKPNANLINDNDRFNLLMKFLAGGARDQAAHLEREMRTELSQRNAAQLDLFLRNKEAYELAKIVYDALPAAEKAGKPVPTPPAPHVDDEIYDKPVEKFWAMMEKLYPEKSLHSLPIF